MVGFILLELLLYPGKGVLHYSRWNLMWTLLTGVLNALGAWTLFAAMKSGGKASIICPLTVLYPLVVVLLVPFVLHESPTPLQGPGVLSALTTVVLLPT